MTKINSGKGKYGPFLGKEGQGTSVVTQNMYIIEKTFHKNMPSISR